MVHSRYSPSLACTAGTSVLQSDDGVVLILPGDGVRSMPSIVPAEWSRCLPFLSPAALLPWQNFCNAAFAAILFRYPQSLSVSLIVNISAYPDNVF